MAEKLLRLQDVHGGCCLQGKALAYFSMKVPSSGLWRWIHVMPSPSHVSSIITEAQVIIMAFKGNSAAAEINIMLVIPLNSYCT